MRSVSQSPAEGWVDSLFSTLPETPIDEPFTVNGAYKRDCNPQKVDLGIGVYRTSEGFPWPLRVVKEAEKQLYEAGDVNRHEYLAIQGDSKFLALAADLSFGFDEDREFGIFCRPATKARRLYTDRIRDRSEQTRSGNFGSKRAARMCLASRPYLGKPSYYLGYGRCANKALSLLQYH